MTTDTIRTIRPEWTLIVDKMILVQLHMGRWRAATRTEFAEFGLDRAAFAAYTAGARRLLPRRLHDELQVLERMARDLLDRYSYKTLFGYLLPKDRYDEFKAWIEDKPAADLRRYLHGKTSTPEAWQTQSLRDRWFALAEEIAQTRNQIVDEVVEAYRPSAVVRWRVENRFAKDAALTPPDAWLDDTLAVMVRRIPTAEDIRRSFRLDIIPAFVEVPDEAVKAAKLEDIGALQREVERRLADLDRIHIQTEREKARLVLLAERERLEREERITADILAHEKKLREERIDKTLNEVAGQLHSLVYTAVCDGLDMVRSKGQLHPRYVGRLKSLVDQVRLLNFTDDAELARVCTELEQMAERSAASKTSAERVRETLVNVGISLKADLVAAGISTRSARDLNIPDDPMPDLVRKARREERPSLPAPVQNPAPVTAAQEATTDPSTTLTRTARIALDVA
jgi:hypothetical protein